MLNFFSSSNESKRNKHIGFTNQLNQVTDLSQLNNMLPAIEDYNNSVELSGNDELIVNANSKKQIFTNGQYAYGQAEIIQDDILNTSADDYMDNIMGMSWEDATKEIWRLDNLGDAIITATRNNYIYKTNTKDSQYSGTSLVKAISQRKNALMSRNHIWKENEGKFLVTNDDGSMDDVSKAIWEDMQYYIISGDFEGVKKKLQDGVTHASQQFKYNENIYNKYLELQQKLGNNNDSQMTYADATMSYNDGGEMGSFLFGDQANSNGVIHPLWVTQRIADAKQKGEQYNSQHQVLTGQLYDEDPLWTIGPSILDMPGYNSDNAAAKIDSNNRDVVSKVGDSVVDGVTVKEKEDVEEISPVISEFEKNVFADWETLEDAQKQLNIAYKQQLKDGVIEQSVVDKEAEKMFNHNNKILEEYKKDPVSYLEDDLGYWLNLAEENQDKDYSVNIKQRQDALNEWIQKGVAEAEADSAEGGGINWGEIAIAGTGLGIMTWKDEIKWLGKEITKGTIQASKYLKSGWNLSYTQQMEFFNNKSVKKFMTKYAELENKVAKSKEVLKNATGREAKKKARRALENAQRLFKNHQNKKTNLVTYWAEKWKKSPQDIGRMFSSKNAPFWNIFGFKDRLYRKFPKSVSELFIGGSKSKLGRTAGSIFQYRVGVGITDAFGVDRLTGKGWAREAATDVAATSGLMWTARKVLETQAGRKALMKVLGGALAKRLGVTAGTAATGIGAPIAVITGLIGLGLTIKDIVGYFNSPEIQKVLQEQE